MKTVLWRLVLILLIALPGAQALAQDDDQEPVQGAVEIIHIDLFVTEADGTERPVLDQTSLETGETLRTDEQGVALITWFYDGTESVLNPNSSLTVNEFTGTKDDPFVLELTLDQGHMVSGLGDYAADIGGGDWVLNTPAYAIKLLRGQIEVSVAEDGASMLYVTEGRAEVMVGDADPITVDEGQYYDGAMVGAISEDGITPALSGVCTAVANTNLVVRMFPSENSQRLDGVTEGQELWVRAGTEGALWLQIYFETDPFQEDLHNFGWVYGPATTLDEAACDAIPRAAIVGRLYGGPGVENAEELEETDPIEKEDE